MAINRHITQFAAKASRLGLGGFSMLVVTVLMLVWGVILIDAQLVTAGALIGAVMFATRAVARITSGSMPSTCASTATVTGCSL